jgi:hypothetical protein
MRIFMKVLLFKSTFLFVVMYWPNSNQNFEENWYLLTIWRVAKKPFHHTHIWQLGSKLVRRHSQSSPFHIACFPTKLYVVNTNAIVNNTMSTINWTGIPIDNNLEVAQHHKICIFVVHIKKDYIHSRCFKVSVLNPLPKHIFKWL